MTTALNLNIPEMQEDLGVDRKTIERLIYNKNTFLKKEFTLLEKAYGVPVSVWAGEKRSVRGFMRYFIAKKMHKSTNYMRS